MSKYKGYHTHRFRDNPEEKRFAEAWAKLNDGTDNVDVLLDPLSGADGGHEAASLRDCRVAATVVQWFGSPVGRGFLRDLGYERREKQVAIGEVGLIITEEAT